jgi:hypothetical protein
LADVVAEQVTRGGEDAVVVAFGQDNVLAGRFGRLNHLVQEQLGREPRRALLQQRAQQVVGGQAFRSRPLLYLQLYSKHVRPSLTIAGFGICRNSLGGEGLGGGRPTRTLDSALRITSSSM